MSLPKPILDDRQFQSIVDEAKKRIPHYSPEWTDHNVSDPGVTLIELLAWMTEIILYRLNQVPDLHFIKFMEMLGIQLQEPHPAHTNVTFWLTAPQQAPVLIPRGTEVSTTQTEMHSPIVFTTDGEFAIQVPDWQTFLLRTMTEDGRHRFREESTRRVMGAFYADGEGLPAFSARPRVGDALYFGFANNLSNHIVRIDFECNSAAGTGVDPTLPPYECQVSTGREDQPWASCGKPELDTTGGLNSTGAIQIHLPVMGRSLVEGQERYWLRLRVMDIPKEAVAQGMKPYDNSPRLRRIGAPSAMGGTVSATHCQTVQQEALGVSNGEPGQRFQLQHTPLLKRAPGENLIVKRTDTVEEWVEVNDFADSKAHDLHYTLNSVTGELRLGPAIRQPDGQIRLFGHVPERGAALIFKQYRFGGGTKGKVQAGRLDTLKTSIPYVAQVRNREPALGGTDPESLDAAMMRAPLLLRTRERAVTAEDFEFLADQALPSAIGRVKCIEPTPDEAERIIPGQVYVIVIPTVREPEGFLTPQQLEPQAADLEKLKQYLDERRLLTVRLEVSQPAYEWVSVRIRLREVVGVDRKLLEDEILRRLYRFINPLTGGRDGSGWPFGRTLYESDVHQCLQGTPGILYTSGLELFRAQPGGGAAGAAVRSIDLLRHGVVASGIHTVVFE